MPLVAGEAALLRVFPTAAKETSARIPPVRATFFQSGVAVHAVDIPGGGATIPTGLDPGLWDSSANVSLPEWLIQPGLEMVVEIDPGGETDPELGVRRRIPEEGRTAVEVRATPPFELTVVPLVWNDQPDYATAETAERMRPGDEYLWMTDELLPVGDLDVEIHARVRTSALADCGDSGANCTPNPFWIMDEIEAMRVAEGSDRHYMGLVRAGAAVALVPGKASVVYPDAKTIAHELGHNLSLRHAPCATEGDPDYPHEEGNIGSWGYRSEYGDNGLVPPVTADLMSYCRPAWISGYHFTKALVHRTQAAASAARAATRSPTRSLLLWGRVDRDGSLVLEPAFVVEAPQRLPATAGPYRLAGRNAGGDVVFSHDFQMSQVIAEDAETGSLSFARSFAFAVPVREAWVDALASITLSGPEGTVEVGREDDAAMALLMDRRTGQVRGFLRDAPATAAEVARVLPERGLDVQVSRGVPGRRAWRR